MSQSSAVNVMGLREDTLPANRDARTWKPVWTRSWVLLLAIVLLGLALRLYRLDYQSVWYDEAFSMTVSRMPLGTLNENLVTRDFHPPLHYYLLHGCFELFGFGSLQARLVSALFGTLAIGMIYLLAGYLFDRRTAWIAALLLAVSQLGIKYSQDARDYAPVSFFVLGTTYCFVRALREKNAWAWWGCVGSAILMTLTHYYAVFALGALLAYALLARKRYAVPWSWWLAGVAVGGLAWLPWLTSGVVDRYLHSNKNASATQPSWFAVSWDTPLLTLNQFNNGALSGFNHDAPWKAFLIGGLLLTLPALLALKSGFARGAVGEPTRDQRSSLLLLVLLWLVPIGCALALSFGAGFQYDVRYVFFCVAFYYILVARGVSLLNVALVRRILLVFIVAYSVFSLRANYYMPYKENWRDAQAFLQENRQEGDRYIFLPYGDLPLHWSVYQGDAPTPEIVDVQSVVSERTRYKRVWLVQYPKGGGWAAQTCAEGKRKLETTHDKREEFERHYLFVDVALYVPRKGAD